MERLAMVYRARPGKKQEYVRAHVEIWPEITSVLERGTVKEMTIFSRGDLIFLFASMDSVQAWRDAQNGDPACERWDAWMATLLEQPYDEGEQGIFAQLEEVWHFKA
ncbi:MAG: L-rhamnose mutarotase [Chloroflexi bacterium]|nr:L-rhamnose mutarotase [Chloroflexota bacterium]